ncbi:MAG: NAD-dependent epimerase/dehydratase family protein, partial [Bacteroidetes bacterium]|nr:NAD-dependent epimerase/dehydratase family protein [Bacteroidota bacterium]
KPFTIFGDGEQQRAFSYVGDIVDIIAESAWTKDAQNEVFNVGADQPLSVNALSKEICKGLNKPNHPIRHLEERNEVKIAFSDHSKAKKVFGERKTTSLEEGINKMATWVLEHGARSSKSFGKIEIYKNLPSLWLEE